MREYRNARQNKRAQQHSVSRFQPAAKVARRPQAVDLKAIARKAMLKYAFEPTFPPAVMAKVNSLDGSLPQRAGSQVRDMRGLLWSSIDNIDTEDLDQIEYCERAHDGEILIRVAIADVDAYVPKGSVLDMHARINTTSVYTGIETFPMLPDRLSKNLSSLPPGKDRLAMVVEFSVLQKGNVHMGKIYPALVRNKAKLVYEPVGAWLEGKGPMPKAIGDTQGLQAQVRLQDEASIRLGKYRAKEGALELETLEARAVIKNDQVLGLYVAEDDRAKRIIENFMIGANGIMSGFLESAGIPTIQRVVRTPKYWREIVEFADARGFRLPAFANAIALSKFLDREKIADPERFPDLSLAIVKLLGPGEYVMYDKRKPLGHFCLAVTSYTHATAPNRRYPDLIIQRLLKAALKRMPSPYGKSELMEASAWCTDRERAAKRVERFMTKAEAAVLLAGKIGQIFDAIITGASEKGVYARLLDPPVEGKIIRQAKRIKIGQKVKVRLANLDPKNGFVDFELAGNRPE
ncbi:TPA: RNB domain-containing ribonuclease [Candidatus Micrarchaeota archaeon]|nr:RNB domain-containing ribonuclease [Candidatus Micrarchaeota archaeon]HIH29776.1 RNB domain-containing ribonuclease [Candidatus Micrarchaeota archaeon]